MNGKLEDGAAVRTSEPPVNEYPVNVEIYTYCAVVEQDAITHEINVKLYYRGWRAKRG